MPQMQSPLEDTILDNRKIVNNTYTTYIFKFPNI